MLLFCFAVIVLQLSFSSCIDMTCSQRDLSISGNNLNERLGIRQGTYKSASACKRACQDTRKIIATCTAWEYKSGASVAGAVQVSLGAILANFGAGPGPLAATFQPSCNLYNGNIQYSAGKPVHGIPVSLLGYQSGPVYCSSERRANVESAVKAGRVTAGWVKLATCSNDRYEEGFKCAYSKQVGISKSTKESTSQSTGESTSRSSTTAAEFSLSYAIEGGDPLGLVKQSLTASASFSASGTSGQGYSWTSESSNSETFTKSARTTTTATFSVAPGSIASICQPVGHLDNFVVHASHFKIVDGVKCP